MPHRIAFAAGSAVLFSLTAAPAAADQRGSAPPPEPFFLRHGPDGADIGAPPASRGAAARPNTDKPGNPSDGPADAQAKAPTPAEALDRLLARLAQARDPDEAKGIATVVQQMWMRSGSDTADLLMSRASEAMGQDRHDVAEALLDKVIALRPGWAEAWNKRATLRFLDGDDTGSMEDISHVLSLEPRHFGALSGMGFILARHGQDAAALKALRRALAVYPGDADVRKAVDKLAPTVEGQEL